MVPAFENPPGRVRARVFEADVCSCVWLAGRGANPKSGVIVNINLTTMQERCAADQTCVGFGRCRSKNVDSPIFTPMANISSEGGDITCQTWKRQAGPAPPPSPPGAENTKRGGITVLHKKNVLTGQRKMKKYPYRASCI